MICRLLQESLPYVDELIISESFSNVSVHIGPLFCFCMEERYDAWLNWNIWSVKVSHLLNLKSGSLRDSLLGRSNYLVNLSLGPGVNPLNYEDTFVNVPTIPLGFGGCGCNWLTPNPLGPNHGTMVNLSRESSVTRKPCSFLPYFFQSWV